MGEGNKTYFFKDAEDGDPILAGRFPADLNTGIFRQPVSQIPGSFGEGREAGLLLFGAFMSVGNADTGIDPGFMDIKPTAVFTKDCE